MTESFLILLAGGVMLAAAISNPKEVTLQWLRLCGIIALAMAALAAFFYGRRETKEAVDWVWLGLSAVMVLGQLGFVQVAVRTVQRAFALLAFVAAVGAGVRLSGGPRMYSVAFQVLACAGVAGMTGLVLMDMLLGHAYLTASRMTMRPFRRLNLALAAALVIRTITAAGIAWWAQSRRPVEMLWGIYGLLIGTRYFVGLVIPGVFTYMADDCIRRRSTQSATGILYVSGLMVFVGELIGLYLLRETGLPF